MLGPIYNVGLCSGMLFLLVISAGADAGMQCQADTGYKVGYATITPTPNPLTLFIKWCAESKMRPENILPSALCMATVQPDGFPAVRKMTLRGYNNAGFRVFTDLTSPKVQEIKMNSKVALATFWYYGPVGKGIAGVRQVRIEGTAVPLPKNYTDAYEDMLDDDPNNLLYRVHEVLDHQSACIGGNRREELLKMTQDMLTKAQCTAAKVPYPDRWGGYNIRPVTIEFLQTAANSITDRLKYVKAGNLGKNGSPCDVIPGIDDWFYEHLEA